MFVICGTENRKKGAVVMDITEKLQILSDAAKYDVACTSSGSARKGSKGAIGNSIAPGICHTFSADGRCISLLKILYTNHCIFDCKYCINRSSNDVVRTSFTPEEVCRLTIDFYRRNYIEGLFLSSGIKNTPTETMAEIVTTLMLLREKYHFNGYIHCKAIPGADPDLLELAGWYADRMSVNLELPTAEGLRTLAPNKNRKNILLPMKQIQTGIEENMLNIGTNNGHGRFWHTQRELGKQGKTAVRILPDQKKRTAESRLFERKGPAEESEKDSLALSEPAEKIPGLHMQKEVPGAFGGDRKFVPAGQSTQMIIGATRESDYQILSVAQALYQKFDLKRVFYSAFVRVNDDSSLPVLPGGPPLRREHRLYQADWLLRYYGFEAEELLSEQQPYFNEFLDPKCDWALRHPEIFPVEINRADYYTLLRVPGVGVKSARKIVAARSTGRLDFPDLKRVGVVLRRAVYFITCDGKTYGSVKMTPDLILNSLLAGEKLWMQEDMSYQQMSMFDGTYQDLSAFSAEVRRGNPIQ